MVVESLNRFLFIIIFLALPLFASDSFASVQRERPVDLFPITPDVNPLLKIAKNLASLPEEKIDPAYAVLRFEKELWPDLNVKTYLNKIEVITKDAKTFIGETKNPEERIRALNTFFYKLYGFRYHDDIDKILSGDYQPGSLSALLDTKKGTCFSLPLLYLAIAQRLGWPVRAVHAPRHMFVRYVDPNLKQQNIETTGYGGFSSDQDYIRDFKISPTALKEGVYLKTLTNRELLGTIIKTHSDHWRMSNRKINKDNYTWIAETAKSIQLVNLAMKLNPSDEAVYIRQGDNYNTLAILQHKSIKEQWANYPKERINKNVLEIVNVEMSSVKAYTAYAQQWYDVARKMGVQQAHFTVEWEKDFKDDFEKGRAANEALQKQFEKERKGALERLRSNSNQGRLKLL